jgi:hypothetical protein
MENVLEEWIIMEDRAGIAPRYARVHGMANAILQAAGIETDIGERWHYNFIDRHPRI